MKPDRTVLQGFSHAQVQIQGVQARSPDRTFTHMALPCYVPLAHTTYEHADWSQNNMVASRYAHQAPYHTCVTSVTSLSCPPFMAARDLHVTSTPDLCCALLCAGKYTAIIGHGKGPPAGPSSSIKQDLRACRGVSRISSRALCWLLCADLNHRCLSVWKGSHAAIWHSGSVVWFRSFFTDLWVSWANPCAPLLADVFCESRFQFRPVVLIVNFELIGGPRQDPQNGKANLKATPSTTASLQKTRAATARERALQRGCHVRSAVRTRAAKTEDKADASVARERRDVRQTAKDKASIPGQDAQRRPRCEDGGSVLVVVCWFRRVEMSGRRTRARRPKWRRMPAARVRDAMVRRHSLSGEAWWPVCMPAGDGMQLLCAVVLA